jgi:hypothetical protein
MGILGRNPVLTAMVVCSMVLGVTVLMAGVAVWRANSICPTERQALAGAENDGLMVSRAHASIASYLRRI